MSENPNTRDVRAYVNDPKNGMVEIETPRGKLQFEPEHARILARRIQQVTNNVCFNDYE